MNNIFRMAVCLSVVTFIVSCADLKQAGREIGHTTKEVTTEIGHTSRDVVKAIGEESKKVAENIKKSGDE